jgi:hypothetical protein
LSATTATDIRWLVPAYILPFCCAGKPRSHLLHSPFLLVFAFCLCIVNAAVIFSWTVTIDRELDDFDAALREMPAGSRVLPLIFMKAAYPRVTPYDQYAFWYVIRAHGAVHGLWSLIASHDGEAPLPHMQHFVAARRYYPEVPGELDWRHISGEYDFIVVAAALQSGDGEGHHPAKHHANGNLPPPASLHRPRARPRARASQPRSLLHLGFVGIESGRAEHDSAFLGDRLRERDIALFAREIPDKALATADET